jgi:hypothetical protein
MKLTRLNRPARFALALALLGLVSGAALRAADDLRARGRAGVAPADSISILDAERSGLLDLMIRGQGASNVRMVMTNRTDQRLRIVLPPGLVAAPTVGQGQGMGFRSIGPRPENPQIGAIMHVSPGQTLDLNIPTVCLNFGLTTPTPEFQFRLVDVSEWTPDPRAQKALRSVSVLGASYGVAQAVAWHVFNNLSFAQMAKQAQQYVNTQEISVAARFMEALDASGSQELVDPAYFQNGRVLVRVRGETGLVANADRLQKALEGRKLFGLPVQVVDDVDARSSRPSSLWVDVMLTPDTAHKDRTQAVATVKHNSAIGGWTRLGNVPISLDAAPDKVGGDDLASAIDKAVAASFVKVLPAGKGRGVSNFRVVNKLPLSVDTVVLRTSRAADAPEVTLDALAIGPNRSGMTSVQAAVGVLERIEFNGL